MKELNRTFVALLSAQVGNVHYAIHMYTIITVMHACQQMHVSMYFSTPES